MNNYQKYCISDDEMLFEYGPEEYLKSRLPAKTLIMMVGLPRSGKTTYAQKTGFPIVSPDAIRLALHGRPFFAPAESIVWATAKLMVASLFEAGHELVILDAANITRERRKEWRDPRWQRHYVLHKTSPEVCRRRLHESHDPEYIAAMEPVIMRMALNYEPPTYDEFPNSIDR